MRHFRRLVPTFLFTILSVWNLFGQATNNLPSEADALMKHCFKNRLFNGVVLVAKGDSVIFEKTYGHAVMEWDVAHTMESKFRIASCTKQFTAMVTLQLVEEGKLDLHVPISSYLPESKNPIAKEITIHHLLSHTSGLPGWKQLSPNDLSYWISEISPDNIRDRFEECTLQFEPGSRFRYGSLGYPLLTTILEEVENKTLGSILHQRILDPLVMSNSGYIKPYQVKKNYALAYENWDFGYNLSEYYNPSHAMGAVGMYSTAYDLLTWSCALTKRTLLSDSLTQKMFSPVTFRHFEGYGYGWFLGFYEIGEAMKRVDYQQHSGGMPGHTSLITRIPDQDLTLILLNNTGHAKLELINYELLKIWYGFDWQMKSSLAVTLNKLSSPSELVEFKKYFYQHEDNFFEGENELCGLVAMKIRNKEIALAEAIYTFAMELYPNSTALPAYKQEALSLVSGL